MPALFRHWLGQITIYRLALYYLRFLLIAALGLSALHLLPFSFLLISLNAGVLVGACFIANFILAKLFKTSANPESAIISGAILSLIMGPAHFPENLSALLLAGFGAMASKYFFAIRHRHIFNPAAFGALLSALVLKQGASWWVGHESLLPFVVLGGFILGQKLRRFHLILAFLLPYLALIFSTAGFSAGLNLFRFSPLLFFSFAMLPEPLTSPATKQSRIFFGMLTAAILFTLQKVFPSLPFSLEVSLLGSNLIFRILNPDERLLLILAAKKEIAPNVMSFWFTSQSRNKFLPGQFWEWTLPHQKTDQRGVRRFFTIASSPTENQILLTTRFSSMGSSFKTALKNLMPGEKIAVLNLGGDFVLPISKPHLKLAFLAGGIGITPFRSMLKFALDLKLDCDITLLYAARSENDLIFTKLFNNAHTAFGLKTKYLLDDKGEKLDEQTIKKEITDYRDRVFYVSGPEPMVAAVTQTLRTLKIPARQIKRDFFPGYSA